MLPKLRLALDPKCTLLDPAFPFPLLRSVLLHHPLFRASGRYPNEITKKGILLNLLIRWKASEYKLHEILWLVR